MIPLNRVILVLTICFFTKTSSAQSLFKALKKGLSNNPHTLYFDSTENKLYAGGIFTKADTLTSPYITVWDGKSWSRLNDEFPDARVKAIVKYKNAIYIGGWFETIGANLYVGGLAKWENGKWFKVATATKKDEFGNTVPAVVNGLKVHNDKLYVFGDFSKIGTTTAYGLAEFDGSSWNGYPSASGDKNCSISTVIHHQDTLYIGGDFYNTKKTAIWNIAKWDGIAWNAIGNGIGPKVNELTIFHNKLYAAGRIFDSKGHSEGGIVKWDGKEWSSINASSLSDEVYTILVYQNNLYAGGYFKQRPSDTFTHSLSYWDESDWHPVDSSMDNGIECITPSSHNSLYIGGGFSSINGDSITRITEYVTTSSFIKTEKDNSKLQVYPNPAQNWIEIITDFPSENVLLQLFDIQGKPLRQEIIHPLHKMAINISELSNGIYILRLTNQTATYSKTIIRQDSE